VDQALGTIPGLKVRLSQSALNYAVGVAVQKMSAKLRTTPVPDQKGKAFFNKVAYEVNNIQVGGDLASNDRCYHRHQNHNQHHFNQ